MSWKKFLDHIKSYHPKLKSLFGTGIGLKFQRKDSDIAEATMLHFTTRNIPILPVHDSFIMHHGYEDELRNVMDREFEKKVGTSIPIKIDKITPDQKAIRQKHDIDRGLYPNFDPTKSIHELTNESRIIAVKHIFPTSYLLNPFRVFTCCLFISLLSKKVSLIRVRVSQRDRPCVSL